MCYVPDLWTKPVISRNNAHKLKKPQHLKFEQCEETAEEPKQ